MNNSFDVCSMKMGDIANFRNHTLTSDVAGASLPKAEAKYLCPRDPHAQGNAQALVGQILVVVEKSP